MSPTVSEALSVIVGGEYYQIYKGFYTSVNTDNGVRRLSTTNENQALAIQGVTLYKKSSRPFKLAITYCINLIYEYLANQVERLNSANPMVLTSKFTFYSRRDLKSVDVGLQTI